MRVVNKSRELFKLFDDWSINSSRKLKGHWRATGFRGKYIYMHSRYCAGYCCVYLLVCRRRGQRYDAYNLVS